MHLQRAIDEENAAKKKLEEQRLSVRTIFPERYFFKFSLKDEKNKAKQTMITTSDISSNKQFVNIWIYKTFSYMLSTVLLF